MYISRWAVRGAGALRLLSIGVIVRSAVRTTSTWRHTSPHFLRGWCAGLPKSSSQMNMTGNITPITIHAFRHPSSYQPSRLLKSVELVCFSIHTNALYTFVEFSNCQNCQNVKVELSKSFNAPAVLHSTERTQVWNSRPPGNYPRRITCFCFKLTYVVLIVWVENTISLGRNSLEIHTFGNI